MRRFNPNAYGNPMAHSSSNVRSATHHTVRAQHDLAKPVKQQEEEARVIMTGAEAKTSTQSEGCEPVCSSPPTELEPNRTLKKHGTLYDSKHCPKHATSESKLKRTSAPSRKSPLGKSNTFAELTKTANFEVVPNPLISHERSQPPENSPNSKNQCAGSLRREPATDSLRPSHSLATGAEEHTDGHIVEHSKGPIDVGENLATMTVASRPTSNHNQTTSPVVNQDEHSMTIEERLALARGKSLKQISLQNRAKDKGTTTSLRDLNLARKPIASNTTQSTFKPGHSQPKTWPRTHSSAPGAPTFNNHNGAALPIHNDSNVPDVHGRPAQAAQPAKRKTRDSNNFGNRESQKARLDRAEATLPGSASRSVLEPVEMDANSNAWGSSIASNASQASKDSVQPLHSGKALQSKNEERPHPLAGWDGAIQPPPADWDDRPRFNNDSPEFHDDFARWNEDVFQMTLEADDSMFRPIPIEKLRPGYDYPDGISMVPKDMTINRQNAQRYGYEGQDTEEILKYSQPINSKDFEDWGKLDKSKPENMEHQHERTEDLISNWTYHIEQRRKSADAQIQRQEQAAQTHLDYRGTKNPNRPILNIYLRPACRADLWQMTKIYNWYIENSPRPAETSPIGEDDMEHRLEDVQSGKLPFIVAIERSLASGIPYDHAVEAEAMRNDPHPIQNIDRTKKALTAQEKIVGWACASDLTARDYVERISAELEIFVDPAYRQLGVGKCLMDKLLESCDRGYMNRGGYSFHCPLEYKHLYNTGGGRDLHKLTFLLRKWKYPRDVTAHPVTQKHPKANPKRKTDDLEKDYDLWLRKWLESWDFEVEGVMKGAGAKNGRFVDVVHFGRETRWQPAEGRIPDPMPGWY